MQGKTKLTIATVAAVLTVGGPSPTRRTSTRWYRRDGIAFSDFKGYEDVRET